MKEKGLDFVEQKGCITLSKICVNLGKVADLKTGEEKYYCTRHFPEDCSKYGCPKYMPLTDPAKMRLRKLSKKELRRLQALEDVLAIRRK